MGDDLEAVLVVTFVVLVLIPAMVWTVRRAKRRAGGFAVAWSLFFGLERMFDGATDRTEQAHDPEWKQRPGADDPPQKS